MNSLPIIEHQLFITSVYSSQLEEANNDIAAKEAYEIQKIDNGRKISNYGGWQSNNLSQDLVENFPEIKKIISLSWQATDEVVKKIGYTKRNSHLLASWININSIGDFNWPHIHPWSQFSACYYIQFLKDAGEIVFVRGDDTEDYLPASQTFSKQTAVRQGFSPKPGTLYVFPSHLEHLVNKNQSEADRISLAFNFAL